MSEAKSAIAALGAVADRLLGRAGALPEVPASSQLVRELGAEADAPKSPPGDVLEEIRQRLAAASRRGELTAIHRMDRRYAPWLLWDGKSPAAELPGVLALVLDEARASRPTLRRLIHAFLRDFRRDATGIVEAAACIRHQLGASDQRLDCWRTAQDEVALFDPDQGPISLATRLLAEPDLTAVLDRCGLGDPTLAAGGYMLAVEDGVRCKLPAFLRDHGTAALERILKLIAPDNDGLRFPRRRAETARALLGAWFTGRGEPAPALQERVRQLLLGWLGDPRLRPQQWSAVGARETALMRSWLARASLDLFFRLIDEQQRSSDKHWPYRRAFWFACLEEGAIEDAWLALGGNAYKSAKTIHELGGAHGRLLGDNSQSALLLKVGQLVFGEFTNVGKVRAWMADWPQAPKLWITNPHEGYRRWHLTTDGMPFPPNHYGKGGARDSGGLSHIGSERGYWQGSVAALIHRHTGIQIKPQQWQPR